jgi:H+/gluconate symporter-like permease
VLAFAWRQVAARFAEGSKAAVGGALLASMNTASEYGFGAVIAALPGFLVIREALAAIPTRWSTLRSPSPPWPGLRDPPAAG